MRIVLGAAALGVGLLPMVAAAQGIENYSAVTDERLKNPEAENWLMTKGNYQGWSYSPLDQITAENVGDLQPVWAYSTGVGSGHEAPPIVNDGVMFISLPDSKLIALDAATGSASCPKTSAPCTTPAGASGSTATKSSSPLSMPPSSPSTRRPARWSGRRRSRTTTPATT